MVTRRAFIANLMASGAYVKAAAAAPRFLFDAQDTAVADEAVLLGSVQSFFADQTWRVFPVVTGAGLDMSTDQDVFLQFGDGAVDRIATASTAIYYPAANLGQEVIGVPSYATSVAIRAVQASAAVAVQGVALPAAYGGASVALRFDGLTAYTLALPPDLEPPFSIICRFRSNVPNRVAHIVTNARYGSPAPQRSVRAAGTAARLQIQESAQNGAQSVIAYGGWAYIGGGSPLWSVVGGAWRGVPGKGRYAHNAATEYYDASDVSDPSAPKAGALPDLVVGADARGLLPLQGLVDWIWIVRHELTQDEWNTLKRINIDTGIWPPDLVNDTAVFIPVQANAPLVNVISGAELAVRAGTVGVQSNAGVSRLSLPRQVDTSLTIPYGATASAPVALPLPNKGIWRAQAHHDVRFAFGGALAGAGDRLLQTGSGVRLLYGSGPEISIIADEPATAGALNLTALV